MFIFYHSDALTVEHIVTIAPPGYAEFLKTRPDLTWVETNENFRLEEIEILPDATLRRRSPMNISEAHGRVGEPVTVSGVPEGALIFFGDSLAGTMDSSGELEFTPSTAGVYTIRFEASGYIKTEISFEVGT